MVVRECISLLFSLGFLGASNSQKMLQLPQSLSSFGATESEPPNSTTVRAQANLTVYDVILPKFVSRTINIFAVYWGKKESASVRFQ